MAILFVHPRRGLFQLTLCQNCGHLWECQNCTAKLVTYQSLGNKLELICHQCQTAYDYPQKCPDCSSSRILSKSGGVEELENILKNNFQKEPIRLDLIKTQMQNEKLFQAKSTEDQIYLTTRIFDPVLNYKIFEKVIFIQAENMLASPDYLSGEEFLVAISQVIFNLGDETSLIFDTKGEIPVFQDIAALTQKKLGYQEILNWFRGQLQVELQNRKKYDFPPFVNLLLLTTQEKKYDLSIKKLEIVREYLQKISPEIPEVTFSEVYKAKFLKRKGYYSHHLSLRFPRNYEHFKALQKIILGLKELYRLQIRLNPRHTF